MPPPRQSRLLRWRTFQQRLQTTGDIVLELDDKYGATGVKFGAVKADMDDYEEVRSFRVKSEV